MLKSKDLDPEEQSELFRLADELQRRDQEAQREHRSATDAAAELGVAPEYLERAAAELHARRLEKIESNRKRNRWIAFGVVGVACVTMFAMVRPSAQRAVRRPIAGAPQGLTLPLNRAELRHNGTDPAAATVAVRDGRLTIEVKSMQNSTGGRPFVNVSFPIESPGNYRKATIRLSGMGLKRARLDLEDGNVRWKNPNIELAGQTTTVSIDLQRSTRQERRGERWRNAKWAPPSAAREVVLKLGDTVNPASESGSVVVESIQLD